jgi:hypothetical protein
MDITHMKGEGNLWMIIDGIQGDMGEKVRMKLMQQADGDIILTLYHTETGQRLTLEFCSSMGGGRQPLVVRKLGELIEALVKQEEG